MSIGRFYAGIGALVWHPPDNTYLLLKRSESKDFAAEDWECVTGRVDQGEGFSEAVHREVYEELGVQARIEFIVGTMHFYRGDPRPENELVGVVYCCSIDDRAAVRLSAEHSERRWVTAQEIDGLLPDGHWLGRVVRRAEAIRKLLPAELWQLYRENRFDL
jgi:8-oxo-dGTP pyrophosphatase MutT (NUDIX family)